MAIIILILIIIVMHYCFRENVVEVDARRIIVNDANGDFQGNV